MGGTCSKDGRRHPPNPLLYAVNAVTWLGRLRQAGHPAKSLAEIPEREFDELADYGFDLVWLMGVWQKGPVGLGLARQNPAGFAAYSSGLPGWQETDVVGSPFAVRAYEVADDLGGPAGLATFREQLRARGIGLVLDFVPNHTARDHAWVFEHPDYYVSGPASLAREQPDRYFLADTMRGPRAIAFGKDPHFQGWIDTAQLNWRSAALRAAMAVVLERIAQLCEGVRCDMAMLPLNDVFAHTWPGAEGDLDATREEPWPHLLDRARAANPGFLLIAEVYWSLEGRLQELGFDYTYDKPFYDHLRGGNGEGLLAVFRQPDAYLRRSVHFIENHDEDPALGCFPPERLRSAVLLAATLPGLRFVHEGQLDGRRVRLPVQLGRPAPSTLPPDLATFYDRVFEIIRDAALRNGEFRRLEERATGPSRSGTGTNVLAFAWQVEPPGASTVVIANVAGAPREVVIGLNLMPIGGRSIVLRDRLTFQDRRVSGDELLRSGLPVSLSGWGIEIVRLEVAP